MAKNPFGDLMVMLPMFWIMNQIDWKNPEYVLYCRVGFGVSAVLCLLFCLYLYSVVVGRNDKRKIRVSEQAGLGQSATEPKEMTVCAYDVSHIKKTITNMVVSMMVVGGIHYKWEMIQPLFLQIFMLPMQIYKNPLFKIYILGSTDPEVNTRPFKEDNPLSSLMPQAPEQPNANSENDSDDTTTNNRNRNNTEPGKSPRVEELEDDDTFSGEEDSGSSSSSNGNKTKKKNNRKKNK